MKCCCQVKQLDKLELKHLWLKRNICHPHSLTSHVKHDLISKSETLQLHHLLGYPKLSSLQVERSLPRPAGRKNEPANSVFFVACWNLPSRISVIPPNPHSWNICWHRSVYLHVMFHWRMIVAWREKIQMNWPLFLSCVLLLLLRLNCAPNNLWPRSKEVFSFMVLRSVGSVTTIAKAYMM